MEREAIEEGDLPGLRAARAWSARGLGVRTRVVSGEHRLCGWRKEVEIRAGRAGQGLGLESESARSWGAGRSQLGGTGAGGTEGTAWEEKQE